MIEGKYSYDNIVIPDKLNMILADSRSRARRQLRRERNKKYGLVAAAFLCVFLLCNNETVYARTSGLPVIGTLVQFLHIGVGGKITDGVKGQFTGEGNTLAINFVADDTTEVPHYQIEYYTMPRRITVSLNGVREFSRENMTELAAQSSGIKDLYFLTVLDDSQVKFTVELADGIGFQAQEYQNPASMRIVFGTEYYEEEKETDKLWTVRIPSMENGEPLAIVQELYSGKAMEENLILVQADLLQAVKTQSGLYTITAGTYKTEEEAKKAADYLNQIQFSDKTWYTEKNGITERPR